MSIKGNSRLYISTCQKNWLHKWVIVFWWLTCLEMHTVQFWRNQSKHIAMTNHNLVCLPISLCWIVWRRISTEKKHKCLFMRCRFSEMNCCPPPALFVEKRVCRITLLKIYEKVFHTRLTFFYFLVFLYTMPAQHTHTRSFFSTQEKNMHRVSVENLRGAVWCEKRKN